MQTSQPTISNNKIIIFVVFVCAALITSLFVYHMSHKEKLNVIAPEDGTLFTASRQIKSFDLLTDENKPFTQQDLRNHWTLLFFGFTHCSSICPTTLDMMNRAYKTLHAAHPDLQVVLVSLDPERDTASALTQYTHSFNPAFIGATGKIQEVRKLQSQLGIFSARDNTGDNYQIQHTSSILLINPKGEWNGLFKSGMKPEQFAQVVDKSLQVLKR